jgi:hypothetical protein
MGVGALSDEALIGFPLPEPEAARKREFSPERIKTQILPQQAGGGF